MYIENRVERDSKLLASIGIFAWDRIQKDVSRALPSSGRSGANIANKMRKALFQLSSNSSFVEYVPEDNFILGPSKYGDDAADPPSIYDQLNTPMDEIKSVTESIRDIISGKNIPTTTSTSQRGLKSVAPGGTSQKSDRQRRAYLRRKETLLAREKESVDKKVSRAAGSVVDAAWEIKRELNVEGNQPGYRTEKIRERAKLAGEQAILAASAGTKEISKLLAGDKKDSGKLMPGSDYNDESAYKAGMSSDIESKKADFRQEQEVEIDKSKTPPKFELTIEALLKERSRFATSLSLCLDQPENTWLAPDTNDSEFNENLDDEALREVITMMILTRDSFDSDINDLFLYGSDFDNVKILENLERMETYIDNIVSLAAVCAGYNAAEKLRAELSGVNEETIGLLSSLKKIREYVESAEKEQENKKQPTENIDFEYISDEHISATESNQFEFTEEKDVEVIEEDDIFVEITISDVLPMDVNEKEDFDLSDEQSIFGKKSLENKFVDTDVVKFESGDFEEKSLSGQNSINEDLVSATATVELVTEDENITEKFSDAKTVSSELEDEVEDKNPNIILTLTLRSFDVLFYIVEKTITVRLELCYFALFL